MRSALMAIFEEPEREQPSFLIGKLRDVLALMALGIDPGRERGGVRRRDQGAHPDHGVARPGRGRGGLLLGAGPVPGPGGQHAALLRLLPPARAARTSPAGRCGPVRSWGPSLFEVLKQLSTFLLKATANSEAFQAFGIALILMVWINYFSRVVVLSAAWAHTSPEARALRDANRVADQMPEGPRIDLAAAAPGVRSASAASAYLPEGRLRRRRRLDARARRPPPPPELSARPAAASSPPPERCVTTCFRAGDRTRSPLTGRSSPAVVEHRPAPDCAHAPPGRAAARPPAVHRARAHVSTALSVGRWRGSGWLRWLHVRRSRRASCTVRSRGAQALEAGITPRRPAGPSVPTPPRRRLLPP